MIESILFTFGLGAIAGVILSFASKIFYVYEDPRIVQVENLLAGANCGGCGFAGCSAAAEAIVKGKAQVNACILIGSEGITEIAEIIGSRAAAPEPLSSYINCTGGERATDRFIYSGINSCRAVVSLYGGKRECTIGCLGYGDCVKACGFDAIRIGPKGYPEIDKNRCVGCGACEEACPKTILEVKSKTSRILHLSSPNDPLAPCTQTCPAEIDIPGYIRHIKNREYEKALTIIREKNPMPLSCGRVCPHPCESFCRRGIEDDPVSINQLKRFVADYEMNAGTRYPIKCAADSGKRVAIIGGGPAGISCAYFLRRSGHHPEIFEAMPKLGGMLRYGIPEYRLPKHILDWEIDGILRLGIDSHTNVRLGIDFEFCSLIAAGFDAVFFSIGAWHDYNLQIPGEEMEGCCTGIDFLSKVGNNEKIETGDRIAVIGGGNTAIDCCRTLLRMGAEKVYLVYRRTRSEMPANEVEIIAAEHEGIDFIFLSAPEEIIGNEEDQVVGLKYRKMELGEPDASGRRRPVPIEGSETVLPVDMVITAVGQSPLLSFRGRGNRLDELEITRWNTFDVNPATCQTNVPYIFAAGDAATGPALVVNAIGGGRKAARSINQFLRGKPIGSASPALLNKHIPEALFDSVPGVTPSKRVEMAELSVDKRIHSFEEVDLTISEQEAVEESRRCLNCCRFCYSVKC